MIDIPELSLVVLVGISGSGKSTFARTHFAPTQVLSSDFFRGLVADDENDQSASADAFDVLHHVAAKRLAAGRLTVVDATNLQSHARAGLIKVAREHDVLPVAVVLDVPESLAWERTQARPDRSFDRRVLTRMHRDLRRSLGQLAREGFRKIHVLRGPDEIAAAEIRYQKLFNDRRDEHGPFDIVGDVHGCRAELETLLGKLGWELVRDAYGRPVDAVHPAGRTAVFVGDLVDRGPDSPGVLRLVMGMVAAGHAICVPGNHEQKLARKLNGRNVQLTHGLPETLEQLSAEPAEFVREVQAFIEGLVSHYVLDGGKLVVAHAGLKEAYHGRASGRVRSFALYGETTGETDEYGLPVRYPWAQEYRGSAAVVYGHVPTPRAEWLNNTICLDTGCVFGGALTALRWPERELVDTPAAKEYYAPVRPLLPVAAAPERGLDIADVTGRKHLDYGYGRITVPAENAAAALEVMGRFSVDPATLVWLPPTMAPCSSSTVDGYLEHPSSAFADLRAAGVDRVVCEEKHMGSRAVVRVSAAGAGDAIWTRTGRPFFGPELDEPLLARVRAAVKPILAELDTDWLLLDAEVLPWSAKAGGLIREHYAGVGAAGRAALPAALRLLDQVAARGLDVAALRDRIELRSSEIDGYSAAYRAYVKPTDGLAGVTLAPFAVLAGAGVSFAGKDHGWHLAMADRLVAADPELFTPTRRMVVDLADPAAEAEATEWWLTLTGAGGEGMVVKPYAGLAAVDGRGRLVQSGVKCRGREYLRIIYGPEYTRPEQLERLRQRNLGRKRSLALREHGLGLAALDRLAEGAPFWRVHELVFAILAAESEPVDPRL
ncbi:polynucleotide kinase-phosphatase [Actinoplanes teichomyceticus]|uniref:Polynucleotide 3'-phosphatase /polynucleotide 5'-hydroxyl-kinase /polynucleotide 2',3'-cyclic phosphate phosphodiesterase n=1 Tax=Actinoplanes teichomyceticus TaxID=1867 RepID=A0A561WRQ0_ACTTI|nr:polynucleotide kinase-phosphatase [Actinoplanes teichomyceticus]TWG26550.1 polynucleotide 3'-phosphatase /polynucleotide 5'-hydroxyl-kinase /polynucleotide 2',3'-cyclic phosphate phosphodiesterase [Actinoplanes teichomyceticus]GIF11626.1 polynucleotide kinase-phosphatase [Actinoplanes teichomyceticus]